MCEMLALMKITAALPRSPERYCGLIPCSLVSFGTLDQVRVGNLTTEQEDGMNLPDHGGTVRIVPSAQGDRRVEAGAWGEEWSGARLP